MSGLDIAVRIFEVIGGVAVLYGVIKWAIKHHRKKKKEEEKIIGHLDSIIKTLKREQQ